MSAAEQLQHLESLGFTFDLSAEGDMTVAAPADVDRATAQRWLEPLRQHRDAVRDILAARASWAATFDSFSAETDAGAWSDKLAELGQAGALPCHHPGGWRQWGRDYRKLIKV